jgi:diguanylate cyclase (GGDEF)-like protein
MKKAVAFFILTATITLAWVLFDHLSGTGAPWEPKHVSIRGLQEVPMGPERLRGIVTYVDRQNKRFWLQDGTGAISIEIDSGIPHINVADQLLLRTKKTHVFDPTIGLQSVGLQLQGVTVLRSHVPLPQAAPATVNTFPDKDKNGLRVVVEGVLHSIVHEPDGLDLLYFGETEQEIVAVVPASHNNRDSWINSRLRITGVSENKLDQGGSVQARYIWVSDVQDVQKIEDSPSTTKLYSVRALYELSKDSDGHRVLLRGRVVSQDGHQQVTIEDEWGAISCESAAPISLPRGVLVQVAGFPLRYGLRVDLAHSEMTPLKVSPHSTADEPGVRALTRISAVRGLTEHQAYSALPVRLTGVVTFNDDDWQQLFLQDATGGIFVKYAGHPGLHRGDKITVIGLTNPGDYAPVIVAPQIVRNGREKLPKPVAMTAEAWSGILDGTLVKAEGTVHPVTSRQNPKHLNFDVFTNFGIVHVVAGPDFGNIEAIRKLEDSKVTITGVGSVIFNSRRQMIGLQIVISRPSDITVVEPGLADPFQGSTVPINSLLRFSPANRIGHRLKVSGAVTMVGDHFFYVQDRTGGARVEADSNGISISDLVDVAGYPAPNGYSPLLRDAVVRIKGHNEAATIRDVTPETLGDGRFDSQLVSIEGTLTGVVNSPGSVTLILRSDQRFVDAVLYVSNSDEHISIPREGSVLRLTGICFVPVSENSIYLLLTKARVGARLIVRSPQDIRVLTAVSWWNVHRTALIAIALLLAVATSLIWISVLGRRIRYQGRALKRAREKNDAINDFIRVIQDVTRNKSFTSRVPVQGTDEIAILSTEFNQMLGELHIRDLQKTEAESRLQHQALTDDLTGLPNRRLLSDRLSQVLEMAKRDRRIIALLYLDLDGFKLVNDSLGHSVGDTLLAEVARRLGARIRKSDTLARLGGDEFTVVLTKLNSPEEAALVANSLLDALSRPFLIEKHEITISASIGISVFPANGMDAGELLQQADSAMYSAKRDGKNRIMYFTSELGMSVRERLNLENQLRTALVKGEITVHYQPEFDIATHRLVRFEALARWQHPTLGNITPDRFIPIAEESGLIIPLGTFVLEQACREAVTWQSIGEGSTQVAVNVSTVQFRRETFVDEVAAALKSSGLDPKLLQLELTESIMLDGTERASNTMRSLAAMGVSIAVDDFGTGYSCFSYLPKLPFNTLKIDRAFVSELGKRAEMTAMIRSLVTLAHNLNMQVVVEGIETAQQLEAIEALGGNEVQGYLLGRPTPDPKTLLRSSVIFPTPQRTLPLDFAHQTKGSEEPENKARAHKNSI